MRPHSQGPTGLLNARYAGSTTPGSSSAPEVLRTFRELPVGASRGRKGLRSPAGDGPWQPSLAQDTGHNVRATQWRPSKSKSWPPRPTFARNPYSLESSLNPNLGIPVWSPYVPECVCSWQGRLRGRVPASSSGVVVPERPAPRQQPHNRRPQRRRSISMRWLWGSVLSCVVSRASQGKGRFPSSQDCWGIELGCLSCPSERVFPASACCCRVYVGPGCTRPSQYLARSHVITTDAPSAPTLWRGAW